jgi:hypothetical protein
MRASIVLLPMSVMIGHLIHMEIQSGLVQRKCGLYHSQNVDLPLALADATQKMRIAKIAIVDPMEQSQMAPLVFVVRLLHNPFNGACNSVIGLRNKI